MDYFTTFDGLRLVYQDAGQGLAVLCLSGLTRNSGDFDYVAPYLPDVRLIRLDYRGRGASAWSQDFMTYSIPVEAQDALELLDYLELENAAILGTSRGGLIAMTMAAMARDRLIGVCLNDIGPDVAQAGSDRIMGFIGLDPQFSSRARMVAAMPDTMAGFANVPAERWQAEVAKHTVETAGGLTINYDPRLRNAVLAAGIGQAPDLWPLFDALAGLPLALIRGANSDLLAPQTAAEMRRRRPDMIFAAVPDRGHIPFLDEPEAVAAIRAWIKACQ